MEPIQAFLLGIMVAWIPSLIFLAVMLARCMLTPGVPPQGRVTPFNRTHANAATTESRPRSSLGF
jgi:hypothetical protein